MRAHGPQGWPTVIINLFEILLARQHTFPAGFKRVFLSKFLNYGPQEHRFWLRGIHQSCLPIKGEVWFSLQDIVLQLFQLRNPCAGPVPGFCSTKNLGPSFAAVGFWSRISQVVYFRENVSLKETSIFFKFPEMTFLMIIHSPLKLTGFSST